MLRLTKDEGPMLKLPYICGMLECKKLYINRNNHTLTCLVIETFKNSSLKKIHVDQICRQLAKINAFYSSMPILELREKVKNVAQIENSIIHLEDNVCYLKTDFTCEHGFKKPIGTSEGISSSGVEIVDKKS